MIYKSVFIFLKKLSFWKYNDIIEWDDFDKRES